MNPIMKMIYIQDCIQTRICVDLYLDGEHLDQNKDKIATGKKVLLSKYDVSEDIKSIEVYVSFFFKLKFKILVNGNIIHQD